MSSTAPRTRILPFKLRARGRVDYFSSIAQMQSVKRTTPTRTSNQRTFGGNVIGAWSNYSLNVHGGPHGLLFDLDGVEHVTAAGRG